ncbi:MAG: ABC transporter substrate-binding protein [Deltaproteobacteria bacterium]|nr:ABC transporter substrate-binding protein [Deltaproteobacteria bacterium]
MDKAVRITLLAATIFACNACLSYDEKKMELDKTTTVYIGAVHSFTGVFATQAVEVEQAEDLAVNHINSAGGVLGKQVVLIKRDTGAQVNLCRSQAVDLIRNEGINYIFGAIESACTNAILNVAVPDGVLTVTGNPYASVLSTGRNNFYDSTQIEYVDPDSDSDNSDTNATADTSTDNWVPVEVSVSSNMFYRTSPNNGKLMKSLASKILLDGNHSLTIIAADNMLAASAADDMERYFSALDCGGTRCQVRKRFNYSSDIDAERYNFSKDIPEILAANSDAIFFSSYPDDGVGFLRAAVDGGYSGRPYISAEMGHASIGGFLDRVTADKIQWVDVPPSSGISFDYFRQKYELTYGEPVSENRASERTYDMLTILALAIHKSGENSTPDKISKDLWQVANPPGELIFAGEFMKAKEMIEQGIDIDYQGASGSCDFDSAGDVPVNQIFMGYDAAGKAIKKY